MGRHFSVAGVFCPPAPTNILAHRTATDSGFIGPISHIGHIGPIPKKETSLGPPLLPPTIPNTPHHATILRPHHPRHSHEIPLANPPSAWQGEGDPFHPAMTSPARQFSLFISLSTAFHAALFVVVAWLLMVGVFHSASMSFPEPAAPEVEEMIVVVEPEVAVPDLPEATRKKISAAIKSIRTSDDQLNPNVEPDDPKFISDRTTHAATEMAPDPDGDVNLPNQRGLDSPVLDLADRNFAKGDYSPEERINSRPTNPLQPPAPPPSPAVAQVPQPAAPTPLTAPKELAPTNDPLSDLKTKSPLDTPRETAMKETKLDKLVPMETPPKTAANDQPKSTAAAPASSSGAGTPRGKNPDAATILTKKNALRGGISNRGKAAVEAAGTEQGKYLARVESAISQKFTPACMRARDRISYGTVEVEFDLNPQGTVENLRVTNPKETSPILQDIVLGVILESKLPPIPKELNDYLIGNRLHITYGFLFH